MSEAASHAESALRRYSILDGEPGLEDFETPQSVAISCLGKRTDQIWLHLMDVANLVAAERGFPKDGTFAHARALRYASEAIEWLWTNADGAGLERYR